MRFQNLFAGVAFASATAAQFVFPDASASLQVNKAIQIQWNKDGLQAPLSINLVPADAAIRQDVVLKQVAVNIGNAGTLQWTADETIAAFPKFAMVITDARAKAVVSQPFVIQSLTRQPTQQIDLGSGNGENKNDNKPTGNKSGKPSNEESNKDANKDANKEEEVTDKEEGNKGSKTSLLPLPGLPASDEAPVSLKPLPAAAQTAAPASSTSKFSSRPATKSASQEKPSSPGTTPAASVSAPPQSSATGAEKELAAAQPAQNGFTTLQPSAGPAAAIPDGSLKAEAVNSGDSLGQQTTEMAVLTALPSPKDQVTITTAITPRPARFASNSLNGLAESPDPTAVGDSKPTALSQNDAQTPCPSLVLGLLGAAACLVLL
ncbi:hypothetical protein LLEC1_05275 [Akanthomyces lecanii]|uniref:Ser-Thr-rich glycosyl-phosphatidyl-inositol-anchored membrane family-domain-containing protein n=1 Tax=Cordyceps confragosa TaxID=2714763 RepID=A0A179IMZ5_CORDF|nr:hypothetical protein LLEC1_05275 [Akanthomyces lecanii]